MEENEKILKQRAASKRWRLKHGEEIRAKERQRYSEKRDLMLEKSKEKYARTREARIASTVKWQKTNPEKVANLQRIRNLRRWYGMTPEEFDGLLAQQGWSCAICRADHPGQVNWHIDHCHSTGKIRGILCRSCNHMLGHSKDRASVLRAAADYLERD